MSKRDQHSTIRNLLLYIKGKLSGKEKNRLEKEMQKDPFEAEAMEGFDSFAPDEIEEDLLEINSRLNRRVKRKNRFTAYRIAASVAVIIGLSLTYFLISNREISEVPVKPEISESLEFSEEKAIDELGEKQEVTADKAKKEQDKAEFPEEKPVQESTAPPVTEKDETVKRPELDMSEIGDETVRVEESEEVKGEIQPEEVLEITTAPEAAETVDMAVENRKNAEAEKETISEDYYRQPARAARKSFTPEIQSAGKKEGLISGVVLSAEDSMPVPGATVWLEGTNRATVTDEQGRFEINPTGESNNELNVSFIGMDPVKTSVSSDAELEILMKPNALALEEVVIVKQGKTAHELTGGASRIENVEGKPEDTYQGAYPLEGKKEFKKYIEENIVFPDSELEKAIVVLKFVISPSGEPKNIEIVRSPGEEFSKEAIRLLIEGPDWSSAKKEGKYIQDEKRIRIVFRKNN